MKHDGGHHEHRVQRLRSSVPRAAAGMPGVRCGETEKNGRLAARPWLLGRASKGARAKSAVDALKREAILRPSAPRQTNLHPRPEKGRARGIDGAPRLDFLPYNFAKAVELKPQLRARVVVDAQVCCE